MTSWLYICMYIINKQELHFFWFEWTYFIMRERRELGVIREAWNYLRIRSPGQQTSIIQFRNHYTKVIRTQNAIIDQSEWSIPESCEIYQLIISCPTLDLGTIYWKTHLASTNIHFIVFTVQTPSTCCRQISKTKVNHQN